MEAPVETIQSLFELNEPTSSADEIMDSGRAVLDSIADDETANPEVRYADVAAEQLLVHWLKQLGPQQREVVEHRFGLHGHGRRTLEEVGRLMGVTRERVRPIQMAALARLKDISRHEGYAEIPFID
jgi:RNA polymerase nonessential primary-like sigma factor